MLVPRGPQWYVRTMGDASHLPHATGDNFPFATFAADAFEMDVIQKTKLLLEQGD